MRLKKRKQRRKGIPLVISAEVSEMTANIEIIYENHKLENYIMDMLTLKTCKLFLPAAFIKTEVNVIASYQTEGCSRKLIQKIF